MSNVLKLRHCVCYKRNLSSAISFCGNSKLMKMMSSFKKPTVYVTRRVPLISINMLQAHCEVQQWDSDSPITQDELLKNVPGVDALFCLLTDRIGENVLEAAGPNLKVIGTMSVGYEHIDLKACKSRGVPIGYTPEVLTDTTAELTVALLLSVSRRIIEGVVAVKTGEWSTWSPLWMCGQGLQNSTVGIVGLGRIGYAVAQRLKPFGVAKLLYSGNSPKDSAAELDAQFVTLDSLLAESGFVIATCPMNDQTKGMFNMEVFKKMKKSAIFVNTSRGGVVNQNDLVEALKTGVIAAAGLDVTVPEPLPTNHPLLALPNCVVLPHIGSATTYTREKMAEITAKNILAALSGKEMIAKVDI